jgi:hypothetical protein
MDGWNSAFCDGRSRGIFRRASLNSRKLYEAAIWRLLFLAGDFHGAFVQLSEVKALLLAMLLMPLSTSLGVGANMAER